MFAPRTVSVIAAIALLFGCQSHSEPQPAVLEAGDIESLARLKTSVAAAMAKSRVEFGPGDLTTSPEIAALPPRTGPFETHSLALPTYFDLATQNGLCVIVKRETGEVFEAAKVICRPLPSAG